MAAAPKPVAKKKGEDGKDLHMFVWRSSASPVSDVFDNGTESYNDAAKEARVAVVSAGEGRSMSSPLTALSGSREKPTSSSAWRTTRSMSSPVVPRSPDRFGSIPDSTTNEGIKSLAWSTNLGRARGCGSAFFFKNEKRFLWRTQLGCATESVRISVAHMLGAPQKYFLWREFCGAPGKPSGAPQKDKNVRH